MGKVVDKLMMILIEVSDMPKAKEFYADKLGLKVKTEIAQDEGWWVSLALPEGGATIINLSLAPKNMKPGTISIYFATSDVAGAHKELDGKGVKVNKVKDDLFGPGSGVKWFNLYDPDGNQVLVVQE